MLKWKSITNTNKMVSLKTEFLHFYAKEKISSISCQKCILNEVKLGYGLSLFKSLFISKSCTKFVLFVLLLHICYLKDDNWSRQSFFCNTFLKYLRTPKTIYFSDVDMCKLFCVPLMLFLSCLKFLQGNIKIMQITYRAHI